MKTRPIIFSGPMVQAILEGRKTQTRRVVKPQPTTRTHNGVERFVAPVSGLLYQNADAAGIRCPYGQPGDLLWVRETWCDLRGGGFGVPVAYRADCLTCTGTERSDAKKARDDYGYTWRPSIHMPRWVSRLTLRITDVRVERVQDISEDNAQAEGARPAFSFPGWDGVSSQPSYRWGFHELWDSINAKRGHGWDTNPWVWVLTFERIRGNVDDVMANLSENLEVVGRGATL